MKKEPLNNGIVESEQYVVEVFMLSAIFRILKKLSEALNRFNSLNIKRKKNIYSKFKHIPIGQYTTLRLEEFAELVQL